jgi:hypothetical protein
MLKLTFPDLFSFYSESDIVENTINPERREYRIKELEDDYYCQRAYNMSFEELLNSKYSYKKGLDNLEKLNLDWEIGGTARKYKWSEVDGDDMSTDRLNDALPFMTQRVKKIGGNNGNFMDLYINMDIIMGYGTESMLNRAYMCIQISDWLEEQGYKTSIIVYDSYSNPGEFRGKLVDKVLIEITLKGYDEPLNKGMLLAATAPWMLRYHLFKFIFNKFTSLHLSCGQIIKGGITKSSININTEGMSKFDAQQFIEKVKKVMLEENKID